MGLVSLNEEKTIGSAIDRLLDETKGAEAELIVVAGGTDGTIEVARTHLASRERSTLIVDSSPRGKPAALNSIMSSARGRFIVLSDGDVLIGKGSLSRLVQSMKAEGVGGASGRVVGSPGKYNLVERVCDYLTEIMNISRKAEIEKSGTIDLASGYLLGIRAELVKSIPEDTNADDGYISATIRSQGLKIAYVENAIVEIRYPKTIEDFLKQKSRTRYGHLQTGRQFSRVGARSTLGEVTESVKMRKSLSPEHRSIIILAVASILVGFTWIIAYARILAPWMFKRRIWQPIASTKG